jgi:hypothetical protein
MKPGDGRRTRRKTPLQDRLAARTTPEPNSGCHLWTGVVNHHGYGMIGLGERRAGIDRTHRVSWRLAFGEIPPGLMVLHRCDTPSCVNPTHLFLGTAADNTADMVRKGRGKLFPRVTEA